MKTMTEMLTGVPAVLALATVALLADGTPVASRDAPEPPPGGYPEIYRLMYATEEGFNADEPDISWYNNKVNDIANNLNGETGSIVAHLGVKWWCIGSTSNVSARQNTKTYKTSDVDYDAAYDVPIYSFAGELLAASNNNLWDGALDSSQTDGIWDRPGFETGEEGFGGYQSVWSGTTSGGDINLAGKYLGTRVWNTDGIGGQVGYLVAAGRADRLNNWIVWFDNGIQSVAPRGGEFDTTMPRLYGLSDPIGLVVLPTGMLFILR